MFIRALQALTAHNKGVVLVRTQCRSDLHLSELHAHAALVIICVASQVGLAGPSGSGKTVFSEKVRAFMPGAPCDASCTVVASNNVGSLTALRCCRLCHPVYGQLQRCQPRHRWQL